MGFWEGLEGRVGREKHLGILKMFKNDLEESTGFGFAYD